MCFLFIILFRIDVTWHHDKCHFAYYSDGLQITTETRRNIIKLAGITGFHFEMMESQFRVASFRTANNIFSLYVVRIGHGVSQRLYPPRHPVMYHSICVGQGKSCIDFGTLF